MIIIKILMCVCVNVCVYYWNDIINVCVILLLLLLLLILILYV